MMDPPHNYDCIGSAWSGFVARATAESISQDAFSTRSFRVGCGTLEECCALHRASRNTPSRWQCRPSINQSWISCHCLQFLIFLYTRPLAWFQHDSSSLLRGPSMGLHFPLLICSDNARFGRRCILRREALSQHRHHGTTAHFLLEYIHTASRAHRFAVISNNPSERYKRIMLLHLFSALVMVTTEEYLRNWTGCPAWPRSPMIANHTRHH
ncbi:hypothetical protein P154DRAFT_283264 [Amniculicola lignicola CBS 123094]|uniref:Uncharacterized protein n=1 Tax=Amniculicola lignicola CBS 123094 TaxID=1392246 RepID=A0A6A5WB57_9PLEO|nr:hypothetical protein P154DRAFT_283264 [Amniculicola lignicola CBS 123094]